MMEGLKSALTFVGTVVGTTAILAGTAVACSVVVPATAVLGIATGGGVLGLGLMWAGIRALD